MLLIILFVKWAIGADVSCFRPYLPFTYGTANGDTHISAVSQYDYNNENHILLMGGYTFDSALTGGGTGKRAWVSR